MFDAIQTLYLYSNSTITGTLGLGPDLMLLASFPMMQATTTLLDTEPRLPEHASDSKISLLEITTVGV